MRGLRIKGLVSVANSVRHDLSRPVSLARMERLRDTVATSLQQVDWIVAKHGVTVEHLPEPTRRAYRFMASVDLNSIPTQTAEDADVPARGNVSLVGIKSYVDRVLAQLAEPISVDKADKLHGSIKSASENIESYLEDNGFGSADLTTQSHSTRGWVAFFSKRENLNAYLAAIARARPAFESAIRHTPLFSTPATIEFRPTRGLYRVRGCRAATRIVLPTPMICFTSELFEALAAAAINKGPKRVVFDAASSEAYQGIQAELEALCGVVEQTAGAFRDLSASFNRVAAAHFGGDGLRPRLTWSGSFTGRTFGYYDPVQDTVMISATLDRADVPEFVLDSVMHHELLHKKLGVGWHNGRMSVHPTEFRDQERRFARFHEAEAILRRLAGET